jgi:hypothetical protein
VPQGDAAANPEKTVERNAAPMLAGRYLLLEDQPLAELDAPGTTACAVQDTHNPSNSLFARVLLPGTILRKELLIPLRSHRDVQIMRPVEWGVVSWPALHRNAFCVLFDRPAGGPLVAANAAGFAPMAVSDITGRVLAPAVRALAQLARRGITHRAVRPDNLFMSGDSASNFLIGECVTSPPGFAQPAAFETIESGMTPPLGRGPGTYNDDLYALGATILALALGRMPLAGMTTEDIVVAKLARGSFIALLAGERVPFGLREVLRGLLADSAKERWGFSEVEQWLGGGMNKSLHDNPEPRMDRPFTFRGKEHWSFRELAHEFGKDWRAASAAILDEQFSKWATRRLRDADLADEVAKTVKSARIEAAANPEPDPKLVSQFSAILDPEGPIRYKGVVARPDGLGPLLAAAMRDGARDEVNAICDLLSKGLAIDWLTWREPGSNADLAVTLRPYKNLQQLLRHGGPGYGPERCLYELNPQLPCQSKGVEPYYVDAIADLLPTLERVVKTTGGLPALFDRHFAAFIACRVKRNLDRDLAALEEARGDPIAGKLGMLKLFAWLQAEHGPVSLPSLCTWLAQDLGSACDRLASKTLRAEMRRRLLLAGDSGDLSQLYNVLQDRALLSRDEQGRRAALQQFIVARREIAELRGGDFGDAARANGWRLSAALGTAAALLSAVVVAVN